MRTAPLTQSLAPIALLERLLSDHCWLCQIKRKPSIIKHSYFCQYCCRSFPSIINPCSICGVGLASSLAICCATCQRHPPPFTQCISGWRYSGDIKVLIHAFKDNERRDYGKALTRELAHHLIKLQLEQLPDALIAVPLHDKRLAQRGFNQALFIAQLLSQMLNVPILNNIVYRNKNTASQQRLSAYQRSRNLNNAFVIHPNKKHYLHAKHIAIIDDVVTTTSTISSLALLLTQNGARRVDAWSLARVFKSDSTCASSTQTSLD